MPGTENTDSMSFWDHLDVLRAALMKIAAVAVVFGVAAFSSRKCCLPSSLRPKRPGLSLTGC